MAAADALSALRAELARRLTDKAGDGATPLPELRELQERLRLVEAAIADPRRLARRRARATWTALVAVAAALSLGALIPLPRVPFTLDAEAGALRLQMAAAGELGAQPVDGELRVDGYTAFESPDAELTRQAGGRGGLVIAAAALNLRRIGYPAGASIDMTAGADAATLAIHGQRAPIGLEAEFSGRTAIRVGQSGRPRVADYPYAEWLRVRAGESGASGAPPPLFVALARRAQTEYAWSGLRPDAARFVERGLAAGNEATVASSLRAARIELQASAERVTLGEGAELELGGLDLQRCDVRIGPVLRVRMTGTAGTLLTRTGHFERSLKPSLLAYAARHKTVELLWGAALSLWGIARWLQRLAANDI